MRSCMFTLAAALVATTALAHGPQIQITVDTSNSNKIVTRKIIHDEPYSLVNGSPVLTAPKSVYVIPISPVTFLDATLTPKTVWRVKPSYEEDFGPGLTYGYDQALGSPNRIFTAGLNIHLAGLKICDGSSFVDTGMEQIGAVRSSSSTVADTVKTTASGVTLPFAINTSYSANQHSGVRYSMLGDGLSDTSSFRDSIYLLELQISGTQSISPLTESDPFFFVLHKHAATQDVVAVVQSLVASQGLGAGSVQYVPEPGSALLAVAGFGLLFVTPKSPRKRS